jgi:transcriptional regulator with XRE-family HTH domain
MARMPRRPRPENVDNPLRVLRGLLSEHGDQKPISQSELSKLVRVSLSSIRSIENGDRALTENVLSHVLLETGAWWKEHNRHWEYVSGGYGRAVPFTRETFLDYRRGIERKSEHPELLEATELLGLALLFGQVSDKDWYRLYSKVAFFYQECCEEFGLKGRPNPMTRPRVFERWQRTIERLLQDVHRHEGA